MKKIISVIMLLCITFTLASCNMFVTTGISMEKPAGKTIIEVEADDYGNYVFFTTKKALTNVSVNRMLYDEENDEYTIDDTVIKKQTLKPEECLKIVVDLEKKIPYIMLKYTLDDETYEQYIYFDATKDKLLMLERE